MLDGRVASDAPEDCKAGGYDIIYWNLGGECADDIENWNYQNIISSPFGSPIGSIFHNTAKAACADIGGHLITNQEWMTIARDVSIQSINWTTGIVGTGYLLTGNSGIIASGYNGDDPEKGLNRNPRSYYILSNNNKVYDMSGNMTEHVMMDINDTLLDNQPYTSVNDGVFKSSELTSFIGYGDLSYDLTRPENEDWNSSFGMGLISHYDGGSVNADRMLRRSCHWACSVAGIFNLDLKRPITNTYQDLGFRCVKN